MIAGRTHPDVARREGERYRLMLERRVLELGLEDHVEFDDRFLSIDELVRPARGDRRVRDAVPQPGADRLRRAHVRDRGRLRRRLDAVLVRAGHARLGRRPARARSTTRPRSPTPSARYIERAGDARARRGPRRGASARRSPGRRSPRRPPRCCARRTSSRRGAGRSGVADLQLTSLRTDHLLTLVDDVGIVQHAHGIIPNRDSGYCVDDVARLAVVVARARPPRRRAAVDVDPLPRARLPARGRRATAGCATSWATTAAGSTSRTSATTSAARSGRSARSSPPRGSPPSSCRRGDLLERLVGALAGDVALRTAAYTVLGLARLDPDRLEPARPAPARALRRAARRRLSQHTPSDDWQLVRGRAQLRQRAAVAGADHRRQRARPRRPDRRSGSSRCAGSATSAASTDDVLRLPGHRGRRRGEPAPGAGDEQPLDAAALVEAELAAFAVTREAEHGVRARRAFEWFLGRNRLRPAALRLRDRRLQRRARRPRR